MATINEIYSLDLRFFVKELKKITGGSFRKIYQYGKNSKQFLFEIFSPVTGEVWLYCDKKRFFVTSYRKTSPPQPPPFCMFLRKHLINKKIKDIKQYGFDRVVEIHTEDSILILELFSSGNIILCDSSYNIIMPLEIQEWKDRKIRPKVLYKHPPKTPSIFEMSFDDFYNMLKKSEKKTAGFLAVDMGFGETYAREICARTGAEETCPASSLSISKAVEIYRAALSLDSKKQPVAYRDFVSPFPLQLYKGTEAKTFPDFSSALDDFFSGIIRKEEEGEEKKAEKEKEEAEKRITVQQEEARKKWKKKAEDSRETADLIYSHYTLVESVIEGIHRARKSGMSWEEIKKRAESEHTPEADAIKEIREHEGTVVLELGGKKVEIDITKTVEENAASYYGRAKHARKKTERIEEAQKKRPEMKAAGKAERQKKKLRKRKKWFEKFRWFISSDDFLVVAGKNARQNEALIKRHAEPGDMAFHADIHGAAFVLIKSGGRQIGLSAIKEAAEFAAAHSKAWSKGMGAVDVYAFSPEQATKTPPSGESLKTGAFVIRGKRQWFRDVEIKLSIGIKIDREAEEADVFSGPVFAVRRRSDYFVTIRPGIKKAFELAEEIKRNILIKARPEDKKYIEKIGLDRIQELLPSGMGDVVG